MHDNKSNINGLPNTTPTITLPDVDSVEFAKEVSNYWKGPHFYDDFWSTRHSICFHVEPLEILRTSPQEITESPGMVISPEPFNKI